VAGLEGDEIHAPPPAERRARGYPEPMVDHTAARQRAIAAFRGLKGE
jgi:deoxyribodipyrimidine photolyase